jgi:hypothetical protein
LKEKIVNILEFVNSVKKKKDNRKLDAKASFIALEKCLNIIEMNSMPELKNLKAMIRRTMKDLRDIGNGR